MAKLKWWVPFVLWFKRARYSYDLAKYPDRSVKITYKMLRGQMFILKEEFFDVRS